MELSRRRIVLDTNCLIISLPSRSRHHGVWQDFLDGRYDLCVTNEILLEYEEILSLKTSREFAELVIDLILNSENVKFFSPTYRFHLITADPDDNKFVDCAACSGASFLVSEDRHMDVLDSIDYPKVHVINLDKYLQIFHPAS